MPPVRNRVPTYKVAKGTSPAPLVTPRATPRPLLRLRPPKRSPSTRLDTQELLGQVEELQAASRTQRRINDGSPPESPDIPPARPPPRSQLIFEHSEEDADFDIEWRVMIDKQPLSGIQGQFSSAGPAEWVANGVATMSLCL